MCFFSLSPFLGIFSLGGGGIFVPRFVFFYLISCANLSGGFFRSRAARTDVMFRNLLPKEVFTGLFSLLHCLQFDEECLPTEYRYIRFSFLQRGIADSTNRPRYARVNG